MTKKHRSNVDIQTKKNSYYYSYSILIILKRRLKVEYQCCCGKEHLPNHCFYLCLVYVSYCAKLLSILVFVHMICLHVRYSLKLAALLVNKDTHDMQQLR